MQARIFRRTIACAVLMAIFGAEHARAQEAIYMPAATQPAKGRFYLRERLRYLRLDDDPTGLNRSGDQFQLLSQLSYGVSSNVSLELDVPVTYRNISGAAGASIHGIGVEDVTVRAKWRIWKEDYGPLDTGRLSLIGGVNIPTGDDDFSSDSLDFDFGAVYTHITGRHGFNVAAQYRLNTGSEDQPLLIGEGNADLLRGDASYLYRLSPASFADSPDAALYGVIEFNSYYSTNGDMELFLSPGILYEARTWAFEAAVRVPVGASLDHSARTQIGVTVGVRVLF